MFEVLKDQIGRFVNAQLELKPQKKQYSDFVIFEILKDQNGRLLNFQLALK